MKIINVSTDSVIPYINNPRNNEAAVDKVAASIQEFGFKVPVIIDKKNTLITGHTRVLAAKKLNMKEIPAIVADDLTDAQIKAFRIADNKVGEYASWDEEALRIELEQLREMDFDLEPISIDYSDFNLDEYLEDETLPDELELERTEQGNTQLKYLKFGSYKITLSDEEYELFNNALETYIEKTGVLQGFISDLLGRDEDD